MRILPILLFFLLYASINKAYSQPEWEKKYDDARIVKKMFEDPPMFYAPHAFWFWDDTLRNDSLPVQMVKEMAKQRLNPGYAHPRSSMDRLNNRYPSLPYDQYLEKIWFNNFGDAVKAAKQSGLTLGYCDEYDWPSGQAAGRVLKQHPELEAKHLVWKRYEVKGGTSVNYNDVDFAVAAKLSGGKIDPSSLNVIEKHGSVRWTAPGGDWILYTYSKQFHAGIDGGKVNYLDPGLMKAFIPLVHEQYALNLGNEMGKTIQGVFVDNEGDYGWHMAWSDHLADVYKKQKKRDIRLWLPLLTEKDNAGLYAKARFDWFDVVSDVYNECFFKPIVNWLNNKDMYYISNLWEESLQLQAGAVGDFMRITRTATIPGTDCLLMKSQDVHDFKEAQTVAEFEDKPFMSEVMGVAGWTQTPEMMKMTLNSATSFGVNHVVPHGIYLSRKKESYPFPADWYTENPYWPYLHNWTDFSRRASFITRQSQLVADILLVNPQESIWANAEKLFDYNQPEDGGAWNEFTGRVEAQYSNAMRQMNEHNLDFLIGDTYYLNKGRVETNMNQVELNINNHIFHTLVLPLMSIISRPVAIKILEFANKGGNIILLGELPTGSPEIGEVDTTIVTTMKSLLKCSNVINLSADKNPIDQLIAILNKKAPQIRLNNTGRLYTMHRKSGNTHFYWFANNENIEKKFTASLRDGNGAAEIWDCESGKIRQIEANKVNGYQNVELTLHPFEAYWLVFDSENPVQPLPVKSKSHTDTTYLNGRWAISYPGIDTISRTSAKAFFSGNKKLEVSRLRASYTDVNWKRSSFIKGSLNKPVNENGIDGRRKVEKLGETYVYWRVTVPAGASAVVFPPVMKNAVIFIDGDSLQISDDAVKLKIGTKLIAFALNAEHLPEQPLKFLIKGKVLRPLQSWFQYGLDEYTGYVDYEKKVFLNKSDQNLSVDLGNVKYMAEVFFNGHSIGSRLWPPFRFTIPHDLTKKGKNVLQIRIGNLMLNTMSMENDLHKLRTWSWGFSPDPELDNYNAELIGPVKLLTTK